MVMLQLCTVMCVQVSLCVPCLIVMQLCVSAGHVGAPLPCNLIKLLDVAEKNYFAAKGEGEVC